MSFGETHIFEQGHRPTLSIVKNVVEIQNKLFISNGIIIHSIVDIISSIALMKFIIIMHITYLFTALI